MVAPQARDRLLNAAVEQALSGGIVDLSLRELASEIGTSHRMLIYHFGSREGLMVAVVQEVERRERETFMGTTLSIEGARRMWDRLTTPGLRSQERLFFEIYSHALLSRPGTEGFLDGVLDGWISPIVGSMVHVGIDAGEAQASARLGIAVTRGLLLDLLATGDRAGVTKAFDLFMRLLTETGFGQDNPDDGMPV